MSIVLYILFFQQIEKTHPTDHKACRACVYVMLFLLTYQLTIKKDIFSKTADVVDFFPPTTCKFLVWRYVPFRIAWAVEQPAPCLTDPGQFSNFPIIIIPDNMAGHHHIKGIIGKRDFFHEAIQNPDISDSLFFNLIAHKLSKRANRFNCINPFGFFSGSEGQPPRTSSHIQNDFP